MVRKGTLHLHHLRHQFFWVRNIHNSLGCFIRNTNSCQELVLCCVKEHLRFLLCHCAPRPSLTALPPSFILSPSFLYVMGGMRTSPIGSRFWTLGSQLVVLFGGGLGTVVLLQEVCHHKEFWELKNSFNCSLSLCLWFKMWAPHDGGGRSSLWSCNPK